VGDSETIPVFPVSTAGTWIALSASGRQAWLARSSAHHFQVGHQAVVHRPSGTRLALDVSKVIDLSGFLCALGEAVNGPGGYFGLSLHALEDCLVGGFGMTPPWVLELSDESHLAAVLDAAALAAWAEDALARGTYLDDQGRDWLIATAHEAKEGQRTLWHEAKKLLLGLGVSVIDLRARTGG
jgi:hypothetical protein